MKDINCTYSPEDNKLRIYPDERLDPETFERVKAEGFRWAPVQKLFVAPAWSPSREDLCIDLAGGIDLEEMTLAERAEIKAARLDGYAERRLADSDAFRAAADRIAEQFAGGQPILIGHYSERRARRDHEKMTRAQDSALRAFRLADYWRYRAAGVESHANRKNAAGVRARRIKTLLADLRGIQRKINHTEIAIRTWRKIEAIEDPEKQAQMARHVAGLYTNNGAYAPADTWGNLRDGKITTAEAIEAALSWHEDPERRIHRERWINHLLGRLSYERSELGPVARFEDDLTAAILQGFCRDNGAEKPQAREISPGSWEVVSTVPLPRHLSEGSQLRLSADGWRDLMVSAGYTVPEKKPKDPPLLNFRAPAGIAYKCRWSREVRVLQQKEMGKAEYSGIWKDRKGTETSLDGSFRFRVAIFGLRETMAVFLKDSKEHQAPDPAAVLPPGAAVTVPA